MQGTCEVTTSSPWSTSLLARVPAVNSVGENLSRALQYAEPVAELIVPDGIPLLLPTLSPGALDVRARASNLECHRRYYEPEVQ